MQTLLLLLLGLLSGCSDRQGPRTTPQAGESLRALGDSRVLSFRRTAVMDTITAILTGKAVSVCTRRPVQFVLGTSKYHAVAVLDGTFRFFHIPASKYALTATHSAYHPLTPNPLELGNGHVAEVTLGLGCDSGKP